MEPGWANPSRREWIPDAQVVQGLHAHQQDGKEDRKPGGDAGGRREAAAALDDQRDSSELGEGVGQAEHTAAKAGEENDNTPCLW
jgi:hypothetical protein